MAEWFLIFYERFGEATEQIKGDLESSDLHDDAIELLNTQAGNVYDNDLKHTESIGKSQEAISSIIKIEKGLVENHLHILPFFINDSF